MNIKYTTSLIAIAAMMSATGMAVADNGSSTYDAAVSILSPDQTGFIIGGQVSVNGLGSGSVSLTRSAAATLVSGQANSGLNYNTATIPELTGVTSGSGITSSITFDRDISTAGSLVGQGSVVARGEAIASLGTAGAASANTTTAGTLTAGGEGSAESTSSSQGSLNGSLSTANTLQLLGTSGLFAGSNALDIGEASTAFAYGNSVVDADTGTNSIALDTAASTAATNGLLSGTGNGALFSVASTLSGGITPIALSVSNAGNGSISITTSTGGFFTGGAATGGSSALAQSGSFFGSSAGNTTTPAVN